MAQKFKVGGSVNHFAKGDGFVVKYDIDKSVSYPITVSFSNEDYTFTGEGRLYEDEEISLRLTGRPFIVGDKVVIGGEKGIVHCDSHQNTKTPVSVLVGGKEHVYITTDGRAWPGTPIIAEHDWEEEGETVNKELDEAVKNSQAFSEYQNQEKEAFDVSPGFAKDWPIDNGIEDVTVSPEEVRHIAEMHGKSLSGQAEIDILKEQHKYTSMALSLTGFKVDNEAAALITETVSPEEVRHIAEMQDIDELEYRKMMEVDALKDQHNYARMALVLVGIGIELKAAALVTEIVKRILELGGEFSLDTACEVEARVNEMYEN